MGPRTASFVERFYYTETARVPISEGPLSEVPLYILSCDESGWIYNNNTAVVVDFQILTGLFAHAWPVKPHPLKLGGGGIEVVNRGANSC